MLKVRVFTSALAALSLLGVFGVEASLRPSPADAEPYHRRVHDAAEALPYVLGPWSGSDVEVPREAMAMLRPNVLVSRRYTNVETGVAFNFLLVACRDARDLLGHFPPICYTGQGYVQVDAQPRDWKAGDLLVTGTEYEFKRQWLRQSESLEIANFMIMPDGKILRDMSGVRTAAASHKRNFMGASQMQLIFDASLPEEERDTIVQTFLRAIGGLIETIRSGVQS